MTDTPMNNPEPTREDVIIGRIVDGEASPSDWHDLDRIAEKDAAVWQRLAQAQRAHARLERAVEDEIAVAELVSLPLHRERAVYDFVSRVRSYGGWAIAAVLALALIGAYNPLSRGTPLNAAGFTGVPLEQATPDQAYDRYLQAGMKDGRVVQEMPSVLVDSKDLNGAQGGEVVIVRRVMERVNLKDVRFYMQKANEFGQPALMPMEFRSRGDGEAETPKAEQAKGVGF
jgi:hypothetical protein